PRTHVSQPPRPHRSPYTTLSRAHATGRLALPPGQAGLRARLTTLAPRSEVRRPEFVQARTALGPSDDGSRRQRRPGGVSTLTRGDRKSTSLNSGPEWISYAAFCL